MTSRFTNISHAQGMDLIFDRLGKDIRLAAPLGLGKPNHLLNSIYDRACRDTSIQLQIFTALSLALPKVSEDLAHRFFAPFAKKHLGENYPDLKYYQDAAADRVPANIQVHEFYVQAGTALSSSHLQRNYQSVNYTHAAENVMRAGVNVIVQLVAKREEASGVRYSLSCNPDMTLDVVDLYRQNGKKLMVIGVVHPDLPFLAGDAEVAPDFFEAIIEDPTSYHELFALPRTPISPEDHLIGFYASQIVRDGGTLQIGIGSLSDAVVCALRLRHANNPLYKDIQQKLQNVEGAHSDTFSAGLYGLTEMLTDGFMHLRKAGILKREVIDEMSGTKTYLHGSFILGSKPFYEWLRTLSAEDARGLRMTRVSKVNDLYDPQESLLRKQRAHPRFFNTTMQVTLLGEAMSETLPNGHVVSGVGGQYNFVTMSSELKNSRSLLMLRSTRLGKDGKRTSNIVWAPGHVTIPRHLRDMVVTEYGVADLKGKSDSECIQALLSITDSQFQGKLVAIAKKSKKLHKQYKVPDKFRTNTPEKIQAEMASKELQTTFVPFPFGSDFSQEEERIAIALGHLQEDKKQSIGKVLGRVIGTKKSKTDFTAELQRLGIDRPKSLKEHIYRKIVVAYLADKF